MKRSIIFSLCVSLLVSCSTSVDDEIHTNEEIVREEFNKYVNLNFDNPDDLQEIVEVVALDTLSYASILEQANIALELTTLVEEGDSLYSREWLNYSDSELSYIMRRYDYSSMTTRNYLRMRELLNKDIEFIADRLHQNGMMRESRYNLLSKLDSLNYYPAIYVYQINYRINTNNNTVVNSHYAYIDSLNGFIMIDPEYNKENVMCREYCNVYDNVIELIDIATNIGDDVSEGIDRLKEEIIITNTEFNRNYMYPAQL